MFIQRKNKKFNYQTRFSEKTETQSDLNNDSETKDFVAKWKRKSGSKIKTRGVMSMKVTIFILVLLLICMYLLEKKYM